MQKIILATESSYKKALFARLNLDFQSLAADIDESPREGESAEALAERLSLEKAESIERSLEQSGSWIIGADQSAQCGNKLVFKPETHKQALIDLKAYSGNTLAFYTAACVISPSREIMQLMDKTLVRFRELTIDEIENYLCIEKPYDCAGAFKAEGLGVSLFESIECTDPTAIIGLPLIKLSSLLRQQGFNCYQNGL